MIKSHFKKRSDQLTFSCLVLVFLLPLALAVTLFIFKKEFNWKTLEYGHLLSPPRSVHSYDFFNKKPEAQWQLVYIQPNKALAPKEFPPFPHLLEALGKEKTKVKYLILTPAELPLLQPGDLGIIDPEGWLILYYSEHSDPRFIIKDLKRLLRYSHAA